jgi:hypothetical protein
MCAQWGGGGEQGFDNGVSKASQERERWVGIEVSLECHPVLEETGRADHIVEQVGGAQVGCGHAEVQRGKELAAW